MGKEKNMLRVTKLQAHMRLSQASPMHPSLRRELVTEALNLDGSLVIPGSHASLARARQGIDGSIPDRLERRTPLVRDFALPTSESLAIPLRDGRFSVVRIMAAPDAQKPVCGKLSRDIPGQSVWL